MKPSERAKELLDKYYDLLYEELVYGKEENPKIYECIQISIDFYNKWIDAVEQHPPIGVQVIAKTTKYPSDGYHILKYTGDVNELCYITEWKLIEII